MLKTTEKCQLVFMLWVNCQLFLVVHTINSPRLVTHNWQTRTQSRQFFISYHYHITVSHCTPLDTISSFVKYLNINICIKFVIGLPLNNYHKFHFIFQIAFSPHSAKVCILSGTWNCRKSGWFIVSVKWSWWSSFLLVISFHIGWHFSLHECGM